MRVTVSPNKQELGRAAAEYGAATLRTALATKKEVAIIVATGASQFEMLDVLVTAPGIDWSRVTAFHLDEYIGLPESHPASFRKYLHERFVSRIQQLKEIVYVNGSANDVSEEIARLGQRIAAHTIDICFAGIGENAHLAFNDPPADFTQESPYQVVNLDEDCRKQQLSEGWFLTLDDVPRKAISMGIRQMMKSGTVVLSVPDRRKARAVKAVLEGPVSNMAPGSILQQHPNCDIFLDSASASLLSA